MTRAVEGDLFSESGGLVWHAKALLRHGTIWADFRNRVDRFLTDWLGDIALYPGEPVSGVILIGPSGGWCLPRSGFLDQFAHVIAIDPDTVARRVFLARHKRKSTKNARFSQEWTWIPSLFQNVLPALLNRHPHHAVLFCNVLGQLRYQQEKSLERIEFEINQIKMMLEGRHWASFHDRISGVGRLSDAQTYEFFEPSELPNQELLEGMTVTGEWLDHLTQQVLPPELGRRFMLWPISQYRLHVIEAGWVNPNATSEPRRPDGSRPTRLGK
jgi:hypothetical protein